MPGNHNCRNCSQVDDDRMVQCDDCDNWFHYSCVGVHSNVAEVSWSCETCGKKGSENVREHSTPQATATDARQPLASSPSVTTTSKAVTENVISGAKVSTLRDLFVDLTSTSSQGQLPTYKVPINSNTTIARDFAPTQTVKPHEPNFMSSSPNVRNNGNAVVALEASRADEGYFTTAEIAQGLPSSNYLFSNAQITGYNGALSIGTSDPIHVNASAAQAPIFATGMNVVLPTATVHEQRAPTRYSSSCFQATSANEVNLLTHRNLQLERLEEEMKIQKLYLDQKYKILSQTGSATTMDSIINNGPSSAQLAARHAIPKGLPNFSGDAEDWPLFISSFENSTTVAGFSDAENLSRLQACLKGKAREIVKHKLYLPSMVPEIIKTLRMCFGRPEHILERTIQRARSLPMVKDKLEAIIEFSLCVQNICATMESCGLQTHLQNPLLVKELVDKLPSSHKLNWAMYSKDDRIPIVKVFSEWLHRIAEAASTVVTISTSRSSGTVNAHFTGDSSDEKEQQSVRMNECKACSEQGHKISQCDFFKNLPLDEKWKIIREKGICRHCLGTHRRKCFLKKCCGVNNCSSKHHKLLHKDKPENPIQKESTEVKSSLKTEMQAVRVNTHSHEKGERQTIFRIVPINIHAGAQVLKTFAFLDEGSSVTLIDQSIFKKLRLKGQREELCLKWSDNTMREEMDSERATIHISNPYNNKKFELKNTHTVRNLDLPAQNINFTALSKQYPHLKGLPIQSYGHVQPKVLIGLNNWALAVPLKIKEGMMDQPIATKTRLGWAIQGGSAGGNRENFVNVHSCECRKGDRLLHDLVKDAFDIEPSKPVQLMSNDDQRALKVLDDTCTKINGRYEAGLMWRDNERQLPDSYSNAHKRMMCLTKHLAKDPSLKQKIQAQIDSLVTKGYAITLPAHEPIRSIKKIWYLPIFVVRNPNKPSKLRLVWDAAAKANGSSLNDFLLSGPDLINSLTSILMSFRVGKIAICADIEEMFHRINVRSADMNAQRFLWVNDGDNEQNPTVYVMRALTFGLNCSPCIAHYVRNKNANEFQQQFPRAVQAILDHHYVDDFIDSEDSEEAAIELAKQVKQIHADAGFNIKGWVSNSTRVLRELESGTSTALETKEWGPVAKILGMYWDPSKDNFRYIFRFARLRRDVLSEGVIPTKRETLQVLMSIYDPLGFISCYTISLKMLIQTIWRYGIDWDDPLNDLLYKRFRQWKLCLPLLAAVEIPRCYSQDLQCAENVQLHTFVDAGENAFAAVSYLRVETTNGVAIAIVAAKSKVAPVKPVSMPRLELQAAVTGVRLASQILQVKRIRTSSQFYWTDSKTVIRWLTMDPKNFKQHVMHRVGEILEVTNVNQWRYVPTRLNPADFATKTTSKINPQDWFKGPEFLMLQPNAWPENTKFVSHEVDCIEVKQTVLVTTKVCKPNFEYFSSWRRLTRAIATFIIYIEKLKCISNSTVRPRFVTFEMWERARRYLFKFAQRERYNDEIRRLKNEKRIESTSKLISLNVYLDENELIRCKGRAEHLNNHEDIILLPRDHYITFLLVRSFHEKYHHQMHETIINAIRGRYHISRLRVLYEKVRRTCQLCKNKSAVPRAPQMAPLPAARLAAFERPFTFVGLDYFGPIYVTVGRRSEKRWGVIFTCLTIRAIHLEIAHSLDSSSCVMAIRNFITRRGSPREIYSDNGTNFKATEKILCDPAYQNKFDTIKWKYNPPASPHMGGAWERLIRTVKTTLHAICPSTKFTEESLRNAFNEVEFIINSRPLTFVSLDTTDDEAITPNHLLIGSTDGYKPIHTDHADLRQRWYQSQKFADRFWRRWLQEYTPIISRRSKWFVKCPPVKVGDVVIIVDDKLERNSWPKGIVTETMTAKDGQVRSVIIKTASSILHRPVTKVAVLDVGNAGSKSTEADSFTEEGMLPPSEAN